MTITTVSSTTDPALAATLAAEATGPSSKPKAQPEPAASTPPDTTVQLPCGYITKDGELHRTAVVSELNGADEEAMAKASSPATVLNTILVRGVQTVGGIPATTDVLDGLLAADRDALLIAVRRVTYGDTVDYEVTCPECSFKQDSSVSLSTDVPVTRMDDPKERWMRVSTSKGEALLTLPTGKAQTAVLAAGDKTVPELNTILLAECVTQIGDQPFTGVLDVRERMSARDRATLLRALQDKVYGPRLGEVTRPCVSCGHKIPLPMTLVDLFRV